VILVADFALLNAGGQNLFGGHVGDRDAGASDLSTEDHRQLPIRGPSNPHDQL
jgi:hypothetical protein